MAIFGQQVAAGLSDPNRSSRLFDAFYEVGATPGRVAEAIREEEKEQKSTNYIANLAKVVTDAGAYSAINTETGEALPTFNSSKYSELIDTVQTMISDAPTDELRDQALKVLTGLNTNADLVKTTAINKDINNIINLENEIENHSFTESTKTTLRNRGLTDSQIQEMSDNVKISLQRQRDLLLEKDPTYADRAENIKLEKQYAAMAEDNKRKAIEVQAAYNMLAQATDPASRAQVMDVLEKQFSPGVVKQAEDQLLVVLEARDKQADREHLNRNVSDEDMEKIINNGLMPEGTAPDSKEAKNARNLLEAQQINADLERAMSGTRILEDLELKATMDESLKRFAREMDIDWNFILDDVYNVVEDILDDDDLKQQLIGRLQGTQKRDYPIVVSQFIKEQNPKAWERSMNMVQRRTTENAEIQDIYEALKEDFKLKEDNGKYYVNGEEVNKNRFDAWDVVLMNRAKDNYESI